MRTGEGFFDLTGVRKAAHQDRCGCLCTPSPGRVDPSRRWSFTNPPGHWDARVAALVTHFRAGGRFPPLIVQWRSESLSVRDGTHREGALNELGERKVWAVIWTDAAPARFR